jgi:plasmid stabilization system protein ParE
MNVIWTRTAHRHLRAVYGYIAPDSRRHAARTVDRIVRRAEELRKLPLLGAEVPEYGDASVRELFFRSYRIIYRNFPDRIEVIAVIHAAMQLPEQPPT